MQRVADDSARGGERRGPCDGSAAAARRSTTRRFPP